MHRKQVRSAEILFMQPTKKRNGTVVTLWLLMGKVCFDEWEMCTVDGCHPNDLGFYKMAKAIAPVLAEKIK